VGLAGILLLGEFNFIKNRATLPPGDSGFPLLGHLPHVIKQGPRDLYLERTKKYGSPSIHIMMSNITILVTSEEDVNRWLTQERKGNASSSVMPHVKKLIGEGAIMLESHAQHRRLRRIFEPSFSPAAVKGYLDIVDRVAREQLENCWSEAGDFQSSKEWSLLAMRLFFSCAFGEVDEQFMETLNTLFYKWVGGFQSLVPYAIPGGCLYKAHEAKKELASMVLVLDMLNDFKAKNPIGKSWRSEQHDGKALLWSRRLREDIG
jgi:cytochrome P450